MVFKSKKEDKKENIRIEISEEEILKRIKQIETLEGVDEELRDFLIKALKALICLDNVIGMKNTTIAKLRKIFEKKLEKSPKTLSSSDEDNEQSRPHPRGNNRGRNGQDKYPNSPRVKHLFKDLKKGDKCPECHSGTLGEYNPGIYIRITGSAPLTAVIHETDKLRCNLCQKIFEAEFEEKNAPKYDEKAKALIALFKYGASMPFHRLDKIQKILMTPLPASTQWDLMEELANNLFPVWKKLLEIAATGFLYYQDDTKGKILSLIKENKSGKAKRKGIFTTGIIAQLETGQKIVLYFTGRKYSGENLSDILQNYQRGMAPIVMSDALGTNKIPDEICQILKVLCLTHGRRQFFDLGEKFKSESDYVISLIKIVYKTESESLDKHLSAEDRLKLHQEKSSKAMEDLKVWCDNAFTEQKIEPNSSLGKAVKYILKNWTELTEFLRTPGVPLDNNILERELRTSVLSRRNWLFYKTEIGALVGDIILSFIKTCVIGHGNIIEYLVWIQKNQEDVKKNPEKYLPWNFTTEMI